MGMSKIELLELLDYIQANNGWNNLYDNHANGRKTPKYVNFKVDTRTGEIWLIEFSSIVGDPKVSSKGSVTFRCENGGNLKERVYTWLDEVNEIH